MPAEPSTIVATARSWLGVPWRHQGRTRQGVDCAGLVVLVGRALEALRLRHVGLWPSTRGPGLRPALPRLHGRHPSARAGPGDILVFADAAYPCHCGFLTVKHEQPHLLHAHALRRKVIEEPYAGEWPAKVKFAFRFRS